MRLKKDREVWKAIQVSEGWAVYARHYDEEGRRHTAFTAICSTIGREKEDAELIAEAVNKALNNDL